MTPTPDEWVEVTSFGQSEPTFILARSGRDVDIAKIKESYVQGSIDVAQLEALIVEALIADRGLDLTVTLERPARSVGGTVLMRPC
jgi:hypothetical protein